MPLDPGPTGQVERDVDQRFVEGVPTAREPPHPRLVAERLGECLAQRDGYVLDRVVGVDVEVTNGVYPEVEAAMASDLIEHVVVERDARGDVGDPGAVEIDVDLDRGLPGAPAALSGATARRSGGGGGHDFTLVGVLGDVAGASTSASARAKAQHHAPSYWVH